jgi:ribonuclease BN (tRNA processing enzyme)
VRLTIVGCAGSVPSPESAASSYLVEADGFSLVLDLGSGALGALARHTSIYDVDALALSHLHADHCLDMCSYYVARRFHPDRPFPRLPVFGPKETEERIARAYGLSETPDLNGEFDFRTYPEGPFAIGPFTARVTRVDHPVTTYAIRVENQGSSLVYSGDTAPSRALVELASEADFFLCEATFRQGNDNPAGLHLTGYEAGQHASRAGVGRLLLTHLPPWVSGSETLAEARESYSGPVDLAVAGATYDL